MNFRIHKLKVFAGAALVLPHFLAPFLKINIWPYSIYEMYAFTTLEQRFYVVVGVTYQQERISLVKSQYTWPTGPNGFSRKIDARREDGNDQKLKSILQTISWRYTHRNGRKLKKLYIYEFKIFMDDKRRILDKQKVKIAEYTPAQD